MAPCITQTSRVSRATESSSHRWRPAAKLGSPSGARLTLRVRGVELRTRLLSQKHIARGALPMSTGSQGDPEIERENLRTTLVGMLKPSLDADGEIDFDAVRKNTPTLGEVL